MKNEMLFKIAEGQKNKLDANMQDAFERIVLAGMEFMYKNEQTSGESIREVEESDDKPLAIGEGVATIMLLLSHKSKGTMPWEAGVMAGYALVCEALDFFEQKGLLPADTTAIDTAMKAYADKLMALLGVDDKRISEMSEMAKTHAKDPKIQAAYKQKYGQEISL